MMIAKSVVAIGNIVPSISQPLSVLYLKITLLLRSGKHTTAKKSLLQIFQRNAMFTI